MTDEKKKAAEDERRRKKPKPRIRKEREHNGERAKTDRQDRL